MSQQEQAIKRSIVELAMDRASTRQTGGSPTPSQPVEHSPVRKVAQEAMDRLTGESPTARADKPQLAGQSKPAEPIAILAQPARARPASRIAGHAVSAAIGAALMWFVLDGQNRASESPRPAVIPAAAEVITPPVVQAVPAPVAETAAVDAQVLDVLERWRQAWSSRDVASYLSHYSAQFVPADGSNRAAWAEGRRSNLLSRSSIDVRIHDATVTELGKGQVKVTLLQDYDSGAYKETRQPKTFHLSLEGNQWKITGEWQGLR